MAIELIRNEDNTVTLKDSTSRSMPDGGYRRHVRHAVTYGMETWIMLASELLKMAAADERELGLRRSGRDPVALDALDGGASHLHLTSSTEGQSPEPDVSTQS